MAANQARRRTDSGHPSSYLADVYVPFSYQALSAESDCTRVLTIQPAETDDEPLVCMLSTVKFSEKPQYDALSYMWGSETEKLPIVVNNARFFVTRNLWDGLRYLRRRKRELPIWIDAISIDQTNVPERNRQLKFMHHIYDRARTVIVWLGEKYAKYRDLIPSIKAHRDEKVEIRSAAESAEGTASVEASNDEVKMVKDLYNDEYWQRLWIIQEIGQAKSIWVCFGHMVPMSWGDFIHLITMHDLGTDGPCRLNLMRIERDQGSYSLQKLLYDHRDSRCKERLDKVYGLVGLARDAHRFPMDYRKSPIRVWKDVMHFHYERGLLQESEIIPLGRLVKFLLMGDTTSPYQQVIQSLESNDDTSLSQDDPIVSFTIRGHLLGEIVSAGPSTHDIVGVLDSVDAWNEAVQTEFSADIGKADLERRRLLHAVCGTSELKKCFNHVSTVQFSWRHRPYGHSDTLDKNVWTSYFSHRDGLMERERPLNDETCQSIFPNLFLVRRRQPWETPWRMGIAAPLARAGDLLVWLTGVRQAIVCRPTLISEYEASFQIIGTAWVTEDITGEQADLQSRVKWFQDGESTYVGMDAATIFILAS